MAAARRLRTQRTDATLRFRVRTISLESGIEIRLRAALIRIHIDHIHPDVPWTKRSLIELQIGYVIHLQEMEGDQFIEPLAKGFRQRFNTVGGLKLPLS